MRDVGNLEASQKVPASKQRSAAYWRIILLRLGYVLAIVSAGLMAFLVGSGALIDLFVSEFGGGAQLPQEIITLFQMIRYGGGSLLALLVAVFLFLTFRPYWWASYCAPRPGWPGLALD